MKKSQFHLVIFLCITGLLFVVNTPEKGSAESIQDYENKIQDLEKEKGKLKDKESDVKGDQSEVKEQMDENKKAQKSSEDKLLKLNEQVDDTNASISDTEDRIKLTEEKIDLMNDEIKVLNEDIETLEERIMKREELLNGRLRSLQEAGGKVPYISVILGSKSFSDLISRSSAVTSIMNQDKSIVEEHFADKEALETKKKEVAEKKEEVEEERANQEKEKSKLQDLKEQLDSQKAEQEEIKKNLEDEYSEMEEYNLSLEEENEIIASRASALEKAKQQAQDEIEKIESQKQAEQNQGGNNGDSGNSGGGNQSGGGDALFSWPVSGVLTSGFGSRSSPGGIGSTYHNGIDIAASKGTNVAVPVNGVVNVVKTGCVEGDHSCGGGYGNYIIVTHYIDGKSYDTLYAHLSRVDVSNGQSVSKGQTIAGVGHTGSSTGPHLHFEIHPGGYKNPVNPLNYLP